jgi:hypothetical protein
VQVFFAEQYKEKSVGHVRVPVKKNGALITCPGVEHFKTAVPT